MKTESATRRPTGLPVAPIAGPSEKAIWLRAAFFDSAPSAASSLTPAELPRASTWMSEPAHFFPYSFAGSSITG